MKDSTTPRISVVVPFRNAERTLPRCLDSILGQRGVAFEVVAVDDASTDGSLAVAEARAAAGEVLRVIRRTVRGGAQRARMEATGAARGDIVVFTDADCEAPPGWLARIEATLTPDLAAVGGQYRVPPGLPLVARFETRSILDYWYRHMPERTDHVATGCCAVWRSHLTPEVMTAGLAFSDITSGDDTVMSLELGRRGPLRYDPELYVDHHTRTSLAAYLGQQLRRGQSRSRISFAHFDTKVRRARDTRMGLILGQIGSAYLAVACLGALPLSGWPLLALGVLPFLSLQGPLLLASARAGEGLTFLALVAPLALLRNLAWGIGGVMGLLRAMRRREVQPA